MNEPFDVQKTIHDRIVMHSKLACRVLGMTGISRACRPHCGPW